MSCKCARSRVYILHTHFPCTSPSKLIVKPQIFTGGTDSRYLRKSGIPALGFSPMNNTPVLLHDHDEWIGAETYLKGIQIYEKIISNLANVE